MRPPPLPSQSSTLEKIIESISAMDGQKSRQPLVVFDLDATLFDNRPRTLQILMEYRNTILHELPEQANALGTLVTDQIEYLLSDTLAKIGITQMEFQKELTTFWRERFFADSYMQYDAPLPGAVGFVQTCYSAGARIMYLTGRDIPGMLAGTVTSLRDCGFPIAVPGTEVILKPTFDLPDEAYKRGILPALKKQGEMVAFFDNEPANCNIAKEQYPDAHVVFLDTQKVPYAPACLPSVSVIKDFRV